LIDFLFIKSGVSLFPLDLDPDLRKVEKRAEALQDFIICRAAMRYLQPCLDMQTSPAGMRVSEGGLVERVSLRMRKQGDEMNFSASQMRVQNRLVNF
jgi:hypothetical protein